MALNEYFFKGVSNQKELDYTSIVENSKRFLLTKLIHLLIFTDDFAQLLPLSLNGLAEYLEFEITALFHLRGEIITIPPAYTCIGHLRYRKLAGKFNMSMLATRQEDMSVFFDFIDMF